MKTDLIGKKGMSEIRGKTQRHGKGMLQFNLPCIHAVPFQEEPLLKIQG